MLHRREAHVLGQQRAALPDVVLDPCPTSYGTGSRRAPRHARRRACRRGRSSPSFSCVHTTIESPLAALRRRAPRPSFRWRGDPRLLAVRRAAVADRRDRPSGRRRRGGARRGCGRRRRRTSAGRRSVRWPAGGRARSRPRRSSPSAAVVHCDAMPVGMSAASRLTGTAACASSRSGVVAVCWSSRSAASPRRRSSRHCRRPPKVTTARTAPTTPGATTAAAIPSRFQPRPPTCREVARGRGFRWWGRRYRGGGAGAASLGRAAGATVSGSATSDATVAGGVAVIAGDATCAAGTRLGSAAGCGQGFPHGG